MLQRFAAGCTVGCLASAAGVLIATFLPGIRLQRISLLLALWCAVPLVWGLWAMLAPARWVPSKLPWWGALLGAMAGLIGGVVLNLPFRVFDMTIPITTRALGIVLGAVIYYVLWSIVGFTHEMLRSAANTGA